MLEHSQLSQLLSGRHSPLWICNLPDRARAAVGCSTGAVYLSKDSANHILEEHPDIDTFQLLLLPVAIMKGTLYKEIRKPYIIISIYYGEANKNYRVVMKVTEQGHELWVCSMHRISPRQVRDVYKRCTLL